MEEPKPCEQQKALEEFAAKFNSPEVQAEIAAEEVLRATELADLEALFDSEDYLGACMYDVKAGEQLDVVRIFKRRWLSGQLHPDQLRKALPILWTFNNHLEQVLSEEQWIDMFRAVGVPILPPEPIPAFRGGLIERGGRGMSWSRDRGVAASHVQGRANYAQKQGGVYFAEIPSHAVLAVIDGGEEEIVIDPDLLPASAITHLDTLDPVPPWLQYEQHQARLRQAHDDGNIPDTTI